MSQENGYHKRVVLVKVIVQHIAVAVSNDGTVVEELPEQPPIAIKAADWPRYPEQLRQALETAEAELNRSGGDVTPE